MNLGEEVDLEDYVGRPDKINNAEIMSICQEAGMQAVRKNRCEPSICVTQQELAYRMLLMQTRALPSPRMTGPTPLLLQMSHSIH